MDGGAGHQGADYGAYGKTGGVGYGGIDSGGRGEAAAYYNDGQYSQGRDYGRENYEMPQQPSRTFALHQSPARV
jgi:hypothetical protein